MSLGNSGGPGFGGDGDEAVWCHQVSPGGWAPARHLGSHASKMTAAAQTWCHNGETWGAPRVLTSLMSSLPSLIFSVAPTTNW